MSDSNAEGEPTMEEILSSIRKIISDDEGEEGTEAQASGTDVLELTERVEEEDSVAKTKTDTTFEDQNTNPTSDSQEETGLVSSTTKSKVTSAMASFAGALTKDKADNNPVMGGGPTLDALVLGALEPVLKNWLDENLEPLVERLVKEELKRMARRAEDDI
jgi:hypothetical protein